MLDSARNLILLLFHCCVASLTHKQQEFVGTLQNVSGNMTTLNSTTLASSKRQGRDFASLLTLLSLQPSVQGVWETVSATYVWLLIPTSVSQRCFRTTKPAWKDTAFVCWNCSNTHQNTRRNSFVFSSYLSSALIVQLMQKGEDYFPHKQTELTGTTTYTGFLKFFVGQTDSKDSQIEQLLNFEQHYAHEIVHFDSFVESYCNLTSKTLRTVLGQKWTAMHICLHFVSNFFIIAMCVGLFVGRKKFTNQCCSGWWW